LPQLYLPEHVIRDDVMSITERVQRGDPDIGWRGDEQMDVYARGNEVAVYGFDRVGDRYQAAVVSRSNPGWRHELLARLRDGDWRNDGHPLARVIESRQKLEADQDYADQQRLGEKADHMAFVMKKHLGAHEGGTTKWIH
jgi:hypothetical protein